MKIHPTLYVGITIVILYFSFMVAQSCKPGAISRVEGATVEENTPKDFTHPDFGGYAGIGVSKFNYRGMEYLVNHHGAFVNVTKDSLEVELMRQELDYLNDEH